MRMKAIVAGVGMTRFGKHMETGLKALGAEAVEAAIEDSGVGSKDLEAAYVGNAMAGLMTGQESIRGQVILRSLGIGRIPVINVENACGSASTAFNQACAMVSAGCYDAVLALGVEKLYHPDKKRTFAALAGGMDVEEMESMLASFHADQSGGGSASKSGGASDKRSVAMDFYANLARAHMRQYGTTVEQLAGVSAKNSFHGSLNPRAQFREVLSVDDVVAAPVIDEPLTRPMCSPIGDGAAAAVVVSERKARQLGLESPVRVVSSVLHSGWDHEPGELDSATLCASEAYEEAGLGPEDLGAVELTEQLQGRCGKRQIEAAAVALAHNGGGVVGREAASMCVTILSR